MSVNKILNTPLTPKIKSTVEKIGNFEVDLDNNVTKLKENMKRISQKDINLNFIENFSRKIYSNPYHLGKIEFLQYIIFLVIIYVYNPLNIKSNYPIFTNVIVLVVSFIYITLFFYVKNKVEDGEDVDLVDITETTQIKRIIVTILFFVLFVLVTKGTLWMFMNTRLINIFRNSMTVMIIIGLLGFVYLMMKKSVKKATNTTDKKLTSLIFKIIMYLPCLLVDTIEYIKYEYNLTPKPVWLLLGVEGSLVLLWLVVPFLFEKISNFNGLKLLNEPINLNKEKTIGNYNALYEKDNSIVDNDNSNIDQYYSDTINNEVKKENEELDKERYGELDDPNMPSNKILAWFYKKIQKPISIKMSLKTYPQYSDYDAKRFHYKYALSGWFYINPQPPNTGGAYTKYTNILKYGEKVKVEYNSQLESLRVIGSVASKSEDPEVKNEIIEFYKTNSVLYQKWNNIVINYDNGYMDIFINGELVGSQPNVAPFMQFDSIVVGATNGIHGGICNITYYKDILKKGDIRMAYKALRDKDLPYVWSMNDEINVNRADDEENDENKSYIKQFKQFFYIK